MMHVGASPISLQNSVSSRVCAVTLGAYPGTLHAYNLIRLSQLEYLVEFRDAHYR